MTQAIAIDGRTISFADQGPRDGLALVYANSLGTDLRSWDALVSLFPDRRQIRWDKAGHGLSDFAGERPIQAHAEDLADLLDQRGVDRAVIVGLSVGGLIALALSGLRPEKIAGLVLCDTAHRIGPPAMWDTRIAAIQAGGIESLAESILERWFSAGFRSERAAELGLWRNMLTRTSAAGYLSVCRAIRNADLTAAARAIKVPTLCIVGSDDLATPPDLVRSMAAIIPGAGFTVIDGVGHLPCIEAPEVLAGLISAFLKEHDLG